MKTRAAILVSGLVLGLVGSAPAGAEEPEVTVVEEILGLLEERGLLDPTDRERMVARYHAQEQERRSLLPKLRLSGDLRLRGEGFWYDEDALGDDAENRVRGRYRLRIAAEAEVNEWITAHARLASGENDSRSTNTSFGRPGPDFDPDPIFIDRASVELRAPGAWLPVEAGSAVLEIGKQPNPFLWKGARDFLLWDNDIVPEGVALRLRGEAARGLQAFAHAGYFLLDENTTRSDPHLIGAQLGAEWSDGSPFRGGVRASWYGFRSLDGDFLTRGISGAGGSTDSLGNLPGGLTDGSRHVDVGELGAYLTWQGSERWPVTVFGYVAHNFSARSSPLAPQAGDESLAWFAGLEVGDKRALVALGLGYLLMEANAFPSQFVDSDVFDGRTNREAIAIWGSRRILPNTDFNLTVFLSEAARDALPDFADSAAQADRLRVQTDLVVGF